MSKTLFSYDKWVSEALVNVLKRTLEVLCLKEDLGEHQIFINFETDYTGVVIPNFLRDQYPKQMAIVLQYQYKKLRMEDDHFEVSLSFNGRSHQLKIPYGSVTHFTDPSVNFGIQIKPTLQSQTYGEIVSSEGVTETSEKRQKLINGDSEKEDNQSAEIISIEAFRDP